jgi:putative NIF3 family GTP cyclohydrolase 1 type 2
MTDDWAQYMGPLLDFVSASFKSSSIGLACDFAPEIKQVRSAVFPSPKVMGEILAEGISDAMLFLHHPATWDIRLSPPFSQMERRLVEQFKERRISIYALHAPLDNFGEYSTTVTLAKALGIKPSKAFAPYNGGLCGVFGETEHRDAAGLGRAFEKAVGHRTSLYSYGSPEIKGGRVALVAGGGNQVEVLEEIAAEGLNTFVSGVTLANDYSRRAHEFARQKGITILGGSHYSTEAFACRAICAYFEGLGLPAKFVADEPVLEDL